MMFRRGLLVDGLCTHQDAQERVDGTLVLDAPKEFATIPSMFVNSRSKPPFGLCYVRNRRKSSFNFELAAPLSQVNKKTRILVRLRGNLDSYVRWKGIRKRFPPMEPVELVVNCAQRVLSFK